MEYSVAKEKVLEFLNRDQGFKLMVYEPAEEQPYGWVFYYNSEGVFHPRLPEVEEKIRRLLDLGKDDEECLEALTSEERTIYENGSYLAGNIPVFIDKDTGEIMFCGGFNLEIDMQHIREQKTGKKYLWKIYLREDVKKDREKVKELRYRLNKAPLEIFQLIDQCNQGKPLLETGDIESMIDIRDFLKDLEVKFEVIEFEK